MKLNLIERFTVLNLIPPEGNFTTLKIIRELQENLSLTEKELKEYEIKTFVDERGETKTSWNEKGREEVEIKMGERAKDIIITSLKKLENEAKLTQSHFSLYEKFVIQ